MNFKAASFIGTIYKMAGLAVFIFGVTLSLIAVAFEGEVMSFVLSVFASFFGGLSIYALGEAFVLGRSIAMSVRLLALQENKKITRRKAK